MATEEKAAAVAPAQKQAEPQTSKVASFFSFFHALFYANPTWVDYWLLTVGTITGAAAGTPFPLMGILFGQLVDNLNTASCATEAATVDPQALQAEINDKILKLVYIAIACIILIYTYLVCWSIFSRRLEARLRDRYFQKLLRQDATFFDKRQAGELTSRMNADIQAVQSATGEKVGICLACTGFFLTGYIVAFIKNAKLAAMLLSLIPAFMGMAMIGSAYTAKFSTSMSDAISSASSIAQETLSHIAVVQAFGAGPRLERKFAAMMAVAQREGIKKAWTAAIQAGMLYFIAYSANALAFWQGSRQIVSSLLGETDVTIGQIYTVVFLLVDSCVVLGYIAPLLPIITAGTASFRKLRADIDAPSAIDPGSEDGEHLPTTIQGGLSFQNISFAYISRPDKPVLNDVSFECPAGKYTALVGLSGSGKSTIAGLASRIYDPTQGTVTIDGHNLTGLNVKNLRSFMSLVQQEPSLLDRSILENIALGLLNSPWEQHQRFESLILSPALAEIATEVRDGKELHATAASHSPEAVELVRLVKDAAGVADAAAFIERLDFGYGTAVGIGGKLVSGGQRQRIALARALIRDPKILILDEATASLDSASEKRIQRAVESIAENRTVIAIAHRLSTIKNADNIIVMNAGKIIEQGTHTELMAKNGSYAGMVRLQNIEAERHDDTTSTASTVRVDRQSTTEKDSIIDEKINKATATPIERVEAEETESTPDTPNEAELDASKPASAVVKRILGLMCPQLMYLVTAIIAGIIVGCTFSAAGVVFGYTIGSINPCHPLSEILWAGSFYGGMYFLLAVVELLANSASWSGFGYVAEKMLYKMRVLAFRSLYTQSLDWHQASGRTSASLLSVVTADTAAVGGFSGSIAGTIFSIIVNFLVAIILCHIVAWKIAIVCLVIVPLLFGAGIMQVRSLSQFERKHSSAFSNAVGITVEAINSFKTVSSLSIEEEILATYRRALSGPQREMNLFSAYSNFWLAISSSIGHLIYAFAYWWGSSRINAGEYNQTQFFIVLISMLVSAQLWGNMFSLAPEVSRAKAAASRILSLMELNTNHEIDENNGDVEAAATRVPQTSGSPKGSTITFRDISFAYPARPHISILNNMSFTIPAGQFVGLVGPSGAGKSTIMSLVQRMYRPTGGVVEIDGVDICARDGTDFRDDIAVVPQDCALFEGTIKFNVGLGARPGQVASNEEIEAACRLANIHDTISSLPDGYNTECGPNGSRLSGGQRQRLAIARALVRQPRLLLLDESTSALDAESERALQEGLERASRGITVIAITHRLHTVRKADVIFVVEGGKVVDKGRHEELVERSESYRINALQQMLD